MDLLQKPSIDTNESQEVIAKPEKNKNILEITQYEKWLVPHISDLSAQEKIKNSKKIEFIVHPLYHILCTQMDQYDSFYENSIAVETANIIEKKGLDAGLLHICSFILKKIDEGLEMGHKFPMGFIVLLDLLQELANYEKPVEDGTVRIFMLPGKNSNYKNGYSTRMVDAYNQFLKTYAQNGDTFVVESQEVANGNVQIKDLALMNKIISNGTTIEIQGGYIGGCVADATNGNRYGVESLLHLKKEKNIILEYDMEGSTGDGINMSDSTRVEEKYNIIPVHVKKPNIDIENFGRDEIKLFMKENSKALKLYDELLVDYSKKNPKMFGIEGVRIIETQDLDEWLEEQLGE